MMLGVSVMAEGSRREDPAGSAEGHREVTPESSKPLDHELVSHSKTSVDLNCKMKTDLVFFFLNIYIYMENAFRVGKKAKC